MLTRLGAHICSCAQGVCIAACKALKVKVAEDFLIRIGDQIGIGISIPTMIADADISYVETDVIR